MINGSWAGIREENTPSAANALSSPGEGTKLGHTRTIPPYLLGSSAGKACTLSRAEPSVGRSARISVNMLSEGWDVKSVSHILGLRAFGSPLLTEQVIGRGLRRTNYDVLNQPLEERSEWSDETVDAFGIPFVGYPVEKRKRPRTGEGGQDLHWIEPDPKKEKYRVLVPNVRSWAVGVTESLADLLPLADLPQLRLHP